MDEFNGAGTFLDSVQLVIEQPVPPIPNGTISWGPSTKYDTGNLTSVTMDNSGHCIETHVGDRRLFYRVGNVNFTDNTINWGPNIKYDTGTLTSISIDNSGQCVETHVGSDRLFYRVGKVNFNNETINWV